MSDTLLGAATGTTTTTGGDPAGGAKQGGDKGGAPAGGEKPWYEAAGIKPEHVTEKVKRFKSPAELVESYNEAQAVIGRKGLAKPGPDAKPEEVDAWLKQLGRPDAPEGYKFKLPEGAELDDATLKPIRENFHKLGLTPEQGQGLIDLHLAEAKQQEEAFAKQVAEERKASETELRKEWKDEFPAKLAAATNIAKELGIVDLLAEAGIAHKPEIIRAMAKIAESRKGDGLLGVQEAETSQSLEKRRDEVNAKLLKMGMTEPGREALVAEREEIYKKLSKK